YKSRGQRPSLQQGAAAREAKPPVQKRQLKDAAPCCFYCSRKMIRAFVKSYGDSSTDTLSPGTIRMKCLRILPEICARTLRCPGRSTRNMVPGNTCVTVASVTICSSFGTEKK